MNKLFNLSLIITLICFGASIHGMKRKNETDLIVQNSNDTNQIQAAPQLPEEMIYKIVGDCLPKEKNQFMRTCRYICACLKNRQLILRANLATVGMTDKVEDLIKYAHDGDVIMTKFLLDNRVYVNAYNCLGIKPFDVAHKNVIPLLVERGANVHEHKPQIHRLHEAVYVGDEETVKALIASGVDLNIPVKRNVWFSSQLRTLSDSFRNSLCIASIKGYTRIVKLLLDECAKSVAQPFYSRKNNYANMVNEAMNDGCMPLHMASRYGHYEIVKLLLAAGADVNKKNPTFSGWLKSTSLFKPLKKGDAEIVRLLIDAGADVNQDGPNGYTYLMAASYFGHAEIVHLLLDKGANINAALFYDSYIDDDRSMFIKRGSTALDIARKKGHTQVIELLEAALQREKAEKQLQETTGSEKDTY